VQQAQFRARNHPQVLVEAAAQSAERLEGLGLPPVAVQREHQLAPSPLPQRAAGHQALQPGDDLMMTAERQFRVDQVLARRLAQLLQSRRLGLGERAVGELLQRRSPPQVQGLPQPPRRGGRVAVPAARGDQAFRQPRVDCLGSRPQAVPSRLGDDAQACQPGHRTAHAQHVVLQRLGGRPGRIATPQRVHQGLRADRLPAVHRQRGHQAALHGPAQRHGPSQLDRPEDPDPPAPLWPVHPSSLPRLRPRRTGQGGGRGRSSSKAGLSLGRFRPVRRRSSMKPAAHDGPHDHHRGWPM